MYNEKVDMHNFIKQLSILNQKGYNIYQYWWLYIGGPEINIKKIICIYNEKVTILVINIKYINIGILNCASVRSIEMQNLLVM